MIPNIGSFLNRLNFQYNKAKKSGNFIKNFDLNMHFQNQIRLYYKEPIHLTDKYRNIKEILNTDTLLERKITKERFKNKKSPHQSSDFDHLAPNFTEIQKMNDAFSLSVFQHRGNLTKKQERHKFSVDISNIEPEKSKSIMQLLYGGEWTPSSIHKESEASSLFVNDNLNAVLHQNKKIVNRQNEFQNTFEEISQEKDAKTKLMQLEQFVFEDSRGGDGLRIGIERLNAHELQSIFFLMWDLEGYDLMVQMMDQSKNNYFTSNPINQELYMRAQLKGHYFNPNNAVALAEINLEKNPDRAEPYGMLGVIYSLKKKAAVDYLSMLIEGKKDLDITEAYKKCFPDVQTDSKAQAIETAKQMYIDSLSNAIVYYEKAFFMGFDPRYGIRAVHKILEQGSIETAKMYAQLTEMACIRDGVPLTDNFSLARAYLECLYLTENSPEHIPIMESKLLSLCHRKSLTDNAINGIDDLLAYSDRNPQMKQFFEKLLEHKQQLTQTDHPKKVTDKHKLEAERLTRELMHPTIYECRCATFDTKGKRSNYIEGNFKFGAQLYAQNINRYDQRSFQEFIHLPISTLLPNQKNLPNTIADIEDYKECIALLNQIIREQFQTEPLELERLDSKGHEVYDDTVKALIRLCGASTIEARKTLSDTRTNIFTNFSIGIGDCRHHAQVKQLVFEIWQQEQMNRLIKELYHTIGEQEGEQNQSILDKFNRLSSLSLRTFDAEVYAPTEIKKGRPHFGDGNMIKNSTGEYVKAEEHTLNVLIDGDRVLLCDSFYHHVYEFDSGEMQIKEGGLFKEGAIANQIKLLNQETGELETHPVILKPTGYSGTRDVYNKASNTVRFIGLPIVSLSANEMINRKSQFRNYLQKALEWSQHEHS